ncbi:hypothetical protein NE237_005515 [Protea cynaroides]|uniref:BZIP domain-containing protein n=1 Tax=Protea cynaroides TaxID=273540 RepID=A0A9Q0KKY8_9MAGN|nr:hypothetical protein NE237_005515 [Protea cynaroides]
MARGMKNVVEMGPLPPRYSHSTVNPIMNRRYSVMLHDAEENLKMIMVISSHLATQKSRVRKSEYIAQLEQEVDILKVSYYYYCKRIELCNENEAIRKRIDELYGEEKLKNAENEWLKQEKHRLSDILILQHQLQQLQLQQEMVVECDLGEEQRLLDVNNPMNLYPVLLFELLHVIIIQLPL